MFSLATYLIEIKDAKNNIVNVNNLGNGESFLDFMNDFLKTQIGKTIDIKSEKKAYFLQEKYIGSKNSVVGKVFSGEYGYVLKIFDMPLNKEAGEVGKNQASLFPYYFGVYVNNMPTHKDRVTLIFSRFKSLGIRTSFFNQLNTEFVKKYNSLRLIIEKIIPQEALDAVLNNQEVKKIRLSKKGLPKSLEDKFSSVQKDSVREFEISISSRNNLYFSDLKWIQDLYNGDIKPSDILSMDGFVPDTVKIDVSINGKKRTFDITNPARLSPTIDISDVEVDDHGHPKKDAIISIIDDIASGIHKGWGDVNANYESSTLVDDIKKTEILVASPALAPAK